MCFMRYYYYLCFVAKLIKPYIITILLYYYEDFTIKSYDFVG